MPRFVASVNAELAQQSVRPLSGVGERASPAVAGVWSNHVIRLTPQANNQGTLLAPHRHDLSSLLVDQIIMIVKNHRRAGRGGGEGVAAQLAAAHPRHHTSNPHDIKNCMDGSSR